MGRVAFFILGAVLFSCAGGAANFPFRYYALDAENYSGKLVSDKPENDLDFQNCAPAQGNRYPCQVMLTDEVKRLKSSYRDLQLENDQLRRQCPK